MHALSDALGHRVVLRGIPAAKFFSPIAPGEEFSIELEIEPGHTHSRFRCVVDGSERVQGRLEYRL